MKESTMDMPMGEALAERIRAHIEEGRWDAMLAAAKELHAYETGQPQSAMPDATTYTPSTAVVSMIKTYRDLRSDEWEKVALAALKVALIRVVEAESELSHDEVTAWVTANVPL